MRGIYVLVGILVSYSAESELTLLVTSVSG
jgi:hypothetical protein